MSGTEPALTTVAVRELCEFTAKRGDLDLRFTPSPTSQQGIEGHGIVGKRRGAGYQREITLQSQYQTLKIRGRADGLRPQPLVLEEIKTYRGDLSRMPDNHRHLHWAQLKIYGAQLCAERGLESLALSLVYYDVDETTETPLTEAWSAQDLQASYVEQCETYLAWEVDQRRHRQLRDAALAAMKFPHPDFHAGQRQLAEAVYRAITRGHRLMAQAPTGIGKSIGTLFPALKAMAKGQVDKLFYLTAKTSGRQMALDALASLQHDGAALPLRVLELVARSKACVHRDKACHGESCPLAKRFYDRLPAAREDALMEFRLDRQTMHDVAARHEVCPYYLSQELVRWADVVIGDYNYYFDGSALLHSLTQLNEWRVAVLVDEAHNLVDRGRAMYSAELSEADIPMMRSRTHRPSSTALKRLDKDWSRMSAAQMGDYALHPAPPERIVGQLTQTVAALGDFYAEHPDFGDPHLQRFYFDALHFLERSESFGEHSVCDLQIDDDPTIGRRGSKLTIRNVVPAPFLLPRIKAAWSLILFSATLNPPHFYRSLLGLPEETGWLDVPSPFAASQLDVRIARAISTRYRDRPRSITPIADLIAAQHHRQPGNYLAFFSSYEFLRQVAEAIGTAHPALPLQAQTSGMSEQQQREFLDRFTDGSRIVGLAVLGGAFAEGIDLPGARLIGAFVATLGLPQVNPVNEVMRQRLAEIFGDDAGHDFAYLYPGLQKVVQAAGRVIRTRADRGVIHLMDDRFAQRRVREVLPSWWSAG